MQPDATACKHKAGLGHHYVNDNFQIFPDNSFQFGDTSDTCVLTNLNIILNYHDLPPLWEVWNNVYPDDPMFEEDAAVIISCSLPFMEQCNPLNDIAPVLSDLIEISHELLAAYTSEILTKKGVLQ